MFYGFYLLSWTFSDVLNEVNFMICNRKINQNASKCNWGIKIRKMIDSKENCEIET